jgi:hypothetical protein
MNNSQFNTLSQRIRRETEADVNRGLANSPSPKLDYERFVAWLWRQSETNSDRAMDRSPDRSSPEPATSLTS